MTAPTIGFLEAALSYAARGWHVFPLAAGAKVPLKDTKGFLDATNDPATIRHWWTAHPTANIGLATGRASGINVIDGDVKHADDPVDSLLTLGGGRFPPETLRCATPTDGWHLYLTADGAEIRSSAGKLGPGLDVRADGGYVVAPPSVVNGKAYRWINDPEDSVAEMPQWLIDAMHGGRPEPRSAPPADVDLAELGSALRCIPNNAVGYDDWRNILFGVHHATAGSAEGQELAREWSMKSSKHDDRFFDRTWRQIKDDTATPITAASIFSEARKHGWTKPAKPKTATHVANVEGLPASHTGHGGFMRTDLGNSERLVTAFGDRLRYVIGAQKWLFWDGARWCWDESDGVTRCAKAVVRSIYAEAALENDAERRAKVAAWAARSEAAARIHAMVDLAKSDHDILVSVDQLDADPWLLGLANGTLNLRTGVLREPRREDFITKRAPVEFDPNATCPTWVTFLDRIFGGQADLIAFMQRAVGYSLTGFTTEQVLLLLHGSGSNGKSTLLGVLGVLLGDYALTAPTETFMERDRNGASSDLARLRGARLVSAIETEDGQHLAESLVKQVTGGDTITARFLYREHFEFKPAFKLWLAVNHRPIIKGDDFAIWRRIRLVPFEVCIPEGERDNDLPAKLLAELPGILNWAVEGCRLWQESGLAAPEAVTAATDEYRGEMDVLQQFFDECCCIESGATVKATALYMAYKNWATTNTGWAISQTKFGRKLTSRGFRKAQGRGGWTYFGIGLTDDDEPNF